MSSPFSPLEKKYMERALRLAARAKGKTSPNPLVGAVFVKENKILGEGFHHRAGGNHAEVEALSKLTPEEIKGGTLYVTLEPCAHLGRTPPCTNFLIKKGIKNMVIAMIDPHPKVNKKGLKMLKNAGIKIRTGLLKTLAEKMNETYIHAVKHKMPFVIVKTASSLDGNIATSTGDSRWISNEKSRKEVHRLRTAVDAIITSANTVKADDSHLGTRMVTGRDPFRVIIDPRLETSPQSKVYRDKNVLVATIISRGQKRKKFEEIGVLLWTYKGTKIPLKKLLKDLYKKEINSVMIEAGRGLFTAFLKQKLVQKGYFFIAPKILGEGIGLVDNLAIQKIDKAIEIQNVSFKVLDDNILVTGYFD